MESYRAPEIETVLFSEKTIHDRLDSLAREITEDYRDKRITLLALFNGSVIFLADLVRRIPLALKIEGLQVASYHGETESSGAVHFHQHTLPDLKDQDVLLLDDIFDTGRTLHAVRDRLLKESHLASLRLAVLLRKDKSRIFDIEIDYVGFDIQDEFVIGYGLDYRGHYRNLPYIATLDPLKLI